MYPVGPRAFEYVDTRGPTPLVQSYFSEPWLAAGGLLPTCRRAGRAGRVPFILFYRVAIGTAHMPASLESYEQCLKQVRNSNV